MKVRESARYCAFHAALLHFVGRSRGGGWGGRPASHRRTSSRNRRISHCVGARHCKQWAFLSLRSLRSVYAQWIITLTMNPFVTEGAALRTGSWGCLCDASHEIQNKHPTSRLWSMIKNLPKFDASASVKKTETKRSLIFTIFWVFSQIFYYIIEVQYMTIVEKKGGEPPFRDTYMLDIFSCGYISFSIADDCLRPKRVCTCKAMDEIMLG